VSDGVMGDEELNGSNYMTVKSNESSQTITSKIDFYKSIRFRKGIKSHSDFKSQINNNQKNNIQHSQTFQKLLREPVNLVQKAYPFKGDYKRRIPRKVEDPTFKTIVIPENSNRYFNRSLGKNMTMKDS
jgi:hypothetical protein